MNWLKSLWAKLFGSSEQRELQAPGELQIVDLALIVGHSYDEQGAVMQITNETEFKFTSRLAKKAQEIAEQMFPQIRVHIVERPHKGEEGILKAYKIANEKIKADLAIELHFNGFNGTAKGSEILCTSDLNDIDFAHQVHKCICEVLQRHGNTDRGVKVIARNARGATNVRSFPGGSNCLIEPFFGDNEEDARLALSRFDQLALSLLKAVDLYAKKMDLIK